VAPNSFTGMVTMPKLMEPLQIALAIVEPSEWVLSEHSPPRDRYREHVVSTHWIKDRLIHKASAIIHRLVNISC
jgi:hypothetical protein